MAVRRSQNQASDSTSAGFSDGLLALAKAKQFEKLKAELASADRLDGASDAVLEAFFRTVQGRDMEAVDCFLAFGIDPNVRWRSSTALGGAARMGDAELIKAMVERGCNVNALGLHESTPVVGACALASQVSTPKSLRPRFEEVVSLLLKLGSDPNCPDMFSFTALDYACEAVRWIRLVRILLDGGARVGCAAEKGASCMNNAAILPTPELLRLLSEHGGQVNHKNHAGTTPLMLAVIHGREENVRLLLEMGADVRVTEIEGLNALAFARKHDRQELLPLLQAAVDGTT
jgi:ankyrin repeat protein